MKIETIPLIVGAIVGLMGILLLLDAWTPDETVIPRERRRVMRAERSRGGETALGFGVLCVAAALLGRDSWPYSIVSAIAGSVLILLGAIWSRRYIKGRLVAYAEEPVAAQAQPTSAPDREVPLESVRDGPLDQGREPTGDEAPAPPPEKRLRIR